MTLGPDTLRQLVADGFGPITARDVGGESVVASLHGVDVTVDVSANALVLSASVRVDLPPVELAPPDLADRVERLLRSLRGSELVTSQFTPAQGVVVHRHWLGREGRHLDDLARAISLLATIVEATTGVFELLHAQLFTEHEARRLSTQLAGDAPIAPAATAGTTPMPTTHAGPSPPAPPPPPPPPTQG